MIFLKRKLKMNNFKRVQVGKTLSIDYLKEFYENDFYSEILFIL